MKYSRKDKGTLIAYDHQPPNHRGLRVVRGERITVTVFVPSDGSSSISSVIMSTAVVRGLAVMEEGSTTLGEGEAARRVLAGAGTVMVWVWMTVLVSVS